MYTPRGRVSVKEPGTCQGAVTETFVSREFKIEHTTNHANGSKYKPASNNSADSPVKLISSTVCDFWDS